MPLHREPHHFGRAGAGAEIGSDDSGYNRFVRHVLNLKKNIFIFPVQVNVYLNIIKQKKNMIVKTGF
jgi:hypothetical protein